MSKLRRSNRFSISVRMLCVRTHNIWSVDRSDARVDRFDAFVLSVSNHLHLADRKHSDRRFEFKLKWASIIHKNQQTKHTHTCEKNVVEFPLRDWISFYGRFFSLLYAARVERALTTTLLGKQSYGFCILAETKDSISFKCYTMHRWSLLCVRVCFCVLFFFVQIEFHAKPNAIPFKSASSFIHHTLNKFM